MEMWQLKQRVSLPLEVKIQMSLIRIRQWYEWFDGDVYVSFSGGKDSTVLAHLVRSIYPNVPLVFCDTGLEYPELKVFVRNKENVVIIKPELTFKQTIEKYGVPIISKQQAHFIKQVNRNPNCPNSKRLMTGIMPDGRKTSFKIAEKWKPVVGKIKVSDQCCDVMKKKPFKKYEKETGRKPYIGTLSSESQQRKRMYLKDGCNAFDAKHSKSTPMAFWTEQDVLRYIKENDLEIASVYGEVVEAEKEYFLTGVSRTGCMFCGFGAHLEEFPNRFQRMKRTHPKLWDYCINRLPMGEALRMIGVETGENDDPFTRYEEEFFVQTKMDI